MRWNSVPSAEEYYVFRSNYSGGALTQIGIATQNAFVDSVPVLGATYYYSIVASDGKTTSPISYYASVYVPPPGPEFYLVKLETSGGSIDARTVVQALNGRPLDYIGEPRRSGYAFLGWSADAAGNGLYDFSQPVLSDFTLYAIWDRQYIITYCRNYDENDRTEAFGGSYAKTAQAILDDCSSVGGGNLDWTRPGYLFTGWSEKPEGKIAGQILFVENDLRLYAQYTVKTHTVKYDYSGFGTDYSLTAGYGTYLESPAEPSLREGYLFAGWYEGDARWEFSKMSVPDRDVTLKAQWHGERSGDCIVTFDTMSEAGKSLLVTAAGNLISRPGDPARDGYVFKGWFSGPAEWNFDKDISPAKSLTLTALWEPGLLSGTNAGFNARIAAQTGNLPRDITAGNIPVGEFASNNYRSLLNLILLIFSVIATAVIAVRSFTKRWKNLGFRSYRTELYGRFILLAGLLLILIFLLSEDFSKPVLLITANTPVVGLLFLTQAVFLSLYLKQGVRANEWADYGQ